MEVQAATGESRGAGLWTPGKVAELLGVSPITLRSWNSRYGIGPSARADGRQRRYSDADVARLRRMRRLIDQGVRAREAAHAVLSDRAGAVPGRAAQESVRALADAAEDLRFAVMAALLDDVLTTGGVVGTWQDVLVPVLRGLGERWLRGERCLASEWGLTGEVSAALDRHVRSLHQTMSGRPVLLACCPGERHTLPLAVLRAALAELRIPAVFLGEMVPRETTTGMVDRLDPALVVLWSMAPATADVDLVDGLRHGGSQLCLAGAGWAPSDQGRHPIVDDLTGAIDLVVGRTP